MGLESTNFISGLNVSWPLAGDTKSQGDDHLRLLKTVLTLSFPTASKPFYFPVTEASTVAMVLDQTDQNNVVMIDTAAADVAVTLPSTLTAADKGWRCQVLRSAGTGTSAVVVSPASGNISSAVGSTATIRIERFFEPATFVWTGTAWFCYKPGAPIGSSMNWDQTLLPPGYRAADGTAYSTTTLAEYNAIKGNATVPDKRGRVEAGLDNGTVNRLTSTYFGVASALGAVGGLESNTLTNTTIPSHRHGVFLSDPGHTHGTDANKLIAGGIFPGGGGFAAVAAAINAAVTGITISDGSGNFNVTALTGSGSAHANVQPTIITNKLVRVC